MPRYGRRSTARLDTCDPLLQMLFNEVIKMADVSILEGERNEEKQNRYVKLNYSQVRWPNSKHNVTLEEKMAGKKSQAVDFAPFPVLWPNKITRPDTFVKDVGRWYYFCGMVKAIAFEQGIEIRMGCDWDSDNEILDNNFDDLPHVELLKPWMPIS